MRFLYRFLTRLIRPTTAFANDGAILIDASTRRGSEICAVLASSRTEEGGPTLTSRYAATRFATSPPSRAAVPPGTAAPASISVTARLLRASRCSRVSFSKPNAPYRRPIASACLSPSCTQPVIFPCHQPRSPGAVSSTATACTICSPTPSVLRA